MAITALLGDDGGAVAAATPGTDYTALAFKTIAVSGQSDIVADSAADTLTVAAGSGVTLTTNAGTDTLTISAPGAGGGTVTHTAGNLTASQLVVGNAVDDIKVVAATDGQIPIGKTSDGTVTLGTITAGAGVTVTNAAAAVTISAPAGVEVDYVEFTVGVTISATTEATANTIVTGNSVSYDGSTVVIIEFFTPFSQNTGSGAEIHYWLYEDGSSIGGLGIHRNVAAVNMQTPLFMTRRMTPSNASHTYSIRAHRVTANGIVGAGTGGSGNIMPGYIRIISK